MYKINNIVYAQAILSIEQTAHNKKPIDRYMKWLQYCLYMSDRKIVSVNDVQTLFKQHLSMTFPTSVISKFLMHARSYDFIIKSHHKFHINRERVASCNFDDIRVQANKQFHEVINTIRNHLSNEDISLTFDETFEAVNKYTEKYAISIMDSEKSIQLDFDPKNIKESMIHYRINKYLLGLKNSSDIHTWFRKLTVACMLTKSYYAISNSSISLSKVSVYLDTPILVNLLDLHSDSLTKPSKEMLKLCSGLECRVMCTKEHYDELYRIINALYKAVEDNNVSEKGQFGESARYIISNKMGSKLLKYKLNLNEYILKLGIQIDRHEYNATYDSDLFYLNTNLEYNLRNQYDDNNTSIYHDDQAKVDSKSICNIIKIRRNDNHYSHGLKKSSALLITRNNIFASLSINIIEKKLRENYGFSNDCFFYPCMLETDFVYMLWMLSPNENEYIPSILLYANCYAGISPSSSFIKRFVEHIKRLNIDNVLTDEEYALLLIYSLDGAKIADLVDGDLSCLMGDLEDVLRNAKERIAAEERKKIQYELEEKQKNDEESKIENVKLKKENEALKEHLKEKWRIIAHSEKNKCKKTMWFFAILIVIMYIVASSLPIWLKLDIMACKIILQTLAAGIVLAVTIIPLFNGFNFKNYVDIQSERKWNNTYEREKKKWLNESNHTTTS